MPAPRCEHGLRRGVGIVIASYAFAIALQALEEGFAILSSTLKLSGGYIHLYIALIGILGFLDMINQGLKAKQWPTEYAVCLISSLIMCSAILGYFDVGFVIFIVIVAYWLYRRFTRQSRYYRRW